MSTVKVPVTIDEVDLKALMAYLGVDDAGEAIAQAVKLVVEERLAEKLESIKNKPHPPHRSVVEETYALIRIAPETAQAIAEDPAFDLWSETECH